MATARIDDDGGEGNAAADKLPEDVIYEIFSWLPAKSILKFKSCCKFIYKFIKEKSFVAKRSRNLTLQGDSSFFVQEVHGNNPQTLSFKASSSSGIPRHFLELLNERPIRILSSSNGLLLCEVLPKGEKFYSRNPKRALIICNPTTQSFSSVVVPHRFNKIYRNYHNTYITLATFGSHHNELLLFEHYQGQESEYIICKVYKPKEGVWKERGKGLLMGYSWALICCYFPGGGCHNMLSYNFESGEMRRLLLPKEATKTSSFDAGVLHYHRVRLFKWDKAVGTSRDDDIYLVNWDEDNLAFTLWILTDCESSSWSKFLTLSLEKMGLKDSRRFSVCGYAVMNGNSLVFTTCEDVYYYDLFGERSERLEKISRHTIGWEFNFISYSSTFRSCGVNARELDEKSYLIYLV